MVGTQCGAREASRLDVEKRPEVRSIALNPTLEAMLDKLVELVAKQWGENSEEARRLVELAVLSRGIAAVSSDVESLATT